MKLDFTVFATPQPQGSLKAFNVRGKRFPILTSDNPRLKSYRQQVAIEAMGVMSKHGIKMAPAGVPVSVSVQFYFAKPKSAPKKRTSPTVKPDVDKLARSCLDAITGIAMGDDSQVVELRAEKFYGAPERTVFLIETWANDTAAPFGNCARGK